MTEPSKATGQGAIAIIGMAGRFPGAATVDAFWDNVKNGVDSIRRFDPGELEDAFSPEQRAVPAYVAARPVLDDVELFDAEFFGMYPREAALTDPQHRVFLECAWEALESAGYDPAATHASIGVFAGCSLNSYFLNNVCQDRQTIESFTSEFQVGHYAMLVGAGQDFLTTRVSYKLDLRGPSVTVGTACSTSLTAVVQACQALQLGQADMVLAGGVSISCPQKRGYLHQQGGMVSADGRCRPFDAGASGTVFGSGAAVVLLKRLDDALADRDTIHAVIRAAAANNDGSRKVGFTAPSIDGQADVIARAQALAGIEARSIGYVECHGTATPLGDPIEFSGLFKAFAASTAARGFCSLGSVKGNVGHLDAAAGVTGLIKAALVVRDSFIPPLAHFEKPNPHIDVDNSPFRFDPKGRAWPADGAPRRAGVSALGVGGTNVHVVIEQAPQTPTTRGREAARSAIVLPVSARSEKALSDAAMRLAAHLESHPELAFADVAHTLQHGRRAFPHRSAVVAANILQAVVRLRDGSSVAGLAPVTPPPVVFLFPGQGAQYTNMGRGLYDTEPVFRDVMDRGFAHLAPLLGLDLRSVLYPDISPDPAGAPPIRATALAQPALFLTCYATARLWMERGVRPTAMVGHSVGELVAASVAGVLSFEDALTLIATRGQLMQACGPGAMLAVRLPEDELADLLPDDLDIAAVNAPRSCVASGPEASVAALEATLVGRGISHRRLHTSHAFHSAMMEPIIGDLEAAIATLTLSAPAIPFASCLSGQWIGDDDAMSPAYWAEHCRARVRFADALGTACGAGEPPVLLEVGPGHTLGVLAARGLPDGSFRDQCGSLPDESGRDTDAETFASATARLWTLGVVVDWAACSHDDRRIPLPTYPFQRQRHWIDAPVPVVRQPQSANAASSLPLQSGLVEPPMPSPASIGVPDPSPRESDLRIRLVAMLEELSGETIDSTLMETSFLELGFDSLFLAQLASQVQKTFKVPVTFRELLDERQCIARLAERLDRAMPPTQAPSSMPAGAAAQPAPAAQPEPTPVAAPVGVPAQANAMAALFQQQAAAMQALFAQQIGALQGQVVPTAPPLPAPATSDVVPRPAPAAVEEPEMASRFKPHRSQASANGQAITPAQQRFIDDLVRDLETRCAGSKQAAQRNRAVLADPRAAAGFRREWKELVFPLVCARSKGSRIWDLDGNDYIDLVNGYGQTAFGHAPDFVVEAITRQAEEGFAIGPQSPLAGEVAAQISLMTGNERVTFCNTGSEAVMAAMRVARAVTGREKVVVFAGGYHGQFDEVLVKGLGRADAPRTLPAASGIPNGSVGNMVVLPYGTPESLAWITAHADDLAAVVVEPVQSRHPGFLPATFLAELRSVTERSGAALVFDEVVTGFRVHLGGMQAVLGIRADLATYGKVVGGGMPIGVLAGKARFMDALDGGAWCYGDGSVPEVAPTFFAGTFVRHPLALAAARAVLRHLEEQGPDLQRRLANRTAALVARFNDDLARRGIASRAETFSSWFHVDLGSEDRLAGLFHHVARRLGVNMQEGYPCFLTTAHSDADVQRIGDVFAETLDRLQQVGILGAATVQDRPSELPDRVPLTEPQREVLMAAQLGPEASTAFNESVSLDFQGPLDHAALQRALNKLVARHDALRAVIDPDGETMRVLAQVTLDLPLSTPETETALDTLRERDARTPFDLAHGPLLRASLVRRGTTAHVLVLTGHHIVCDGWSFNVILPELLELYRAELEGRAPSLPPAPSYRRYAIERAADRAGAGDDEVYWLAQYASLPPLLELPSDRSRTAHKSFRGATYRDAIDGNLTRALKAVGARRGCTLFATLLAAFTTLVARLADEEDVVVAVPAAGQSLAGADGLVGHAVHLLPLRVRVPQDAAFTDHLQTVKRQLLDAYDHGGTTFGTLVRRLALPRDPSRLPLTQIQFNLERVSATPDLPGLAITVASNPKAASNFDLFANFSESREGLRIDCDYNTDLFDDATLARWMGHLRVLLATIVADAGRPVGDLPLLSDDNIERLMASSVGATPPGLDLRPVHDLVATQAARTPEAIAVVWRDDSLTYGVLDRQSNRLARAIREVVPQRGCRIAIATGRNLSMVVGLLAIMKAGHAYVPIDRDQPAARQKAILDRADAAAVLCDSPPAWAGQAGSPPLIDLTAHAAGVLQKSDETLPHDAVEDGGERSAYVIFTSGSTGEPKGVEVTHRAFANLLWSMADRPGCTAADTLLAVTTLAFDIAGAELFLPLVTGGRVILADRDDVRDGFRLVEQIGRSNVTMLQATPSLWRMLVEAGFRAPPLFTMISGGEALPRDLADRLLEGEGVLWNAYGPTETTIWSSIGKVEAEPRTIGIGEPVFNTTLHVLDARGGLAPVGVAGELHIGGLGLARGYFQRPDLTAEAFRDRSLPDGGVQRLYHTGDRAKRLPDGRVQLLGRRDHQIKLFGHRIELGEIEAVLRRCPGVAQAAVALAEGEHPRLIGYYAAAPDLMIEDRDLVRHAATALPAAMVPSRWMRLDAMPLTPNGKLDRKALPVPDTRQADTRGQKPETPLQAEIARVIEAVLGRSAIGIHDNLFALGADSIQVFRIAARLMAQGVPIPAGQIMRSPTVAELAATATVPADPTGVPSLRSFRRTSRNLGVLA